MNGDQTPLHALCDTPLAVIDGLAGAPGVHTYVRASVWGCPECSTQGMLQHLPTYVAERLDEAHVPLLKPGPPSEPRWWQSYLDDFCSRGLLMVSAHGPPDHAIRDTSVFVVTDKVTVEGLDDPRPSLVVFDHEAERPHVLSDVARLWQQEPGVLIVQGAERHHARLDTRLTEGETAYVHRMRNTDYFGVARSCGAVACPYCNSLKPKEEPT